MAVFNKFEDFVEQLGKGIHQLHAAGHTFKVYLSNTTPSASADAVVADLAPFGTGTGYTAGGTDIQNDYTETGGVGTMIAIDVLWTAGAADWAAFRYVPIYNDTPSAPADPLMGWYDYGSPVTLGNGETFAVDFGPSLATIT